ncbi:MAG: hypothetical protein A4S09_02635 [Proteobacteria bacterium SG_bin7]|nr:MAG: hypothetical protein A4S09_02635 [Proteobacteria bacterium SG_bin7]
MKYARLLLSLGIFVSFGLAHAEDVPADPAIQTQRSTEASPETAPAPEPIPESKIEEATPEPPPEKTQEPELEKSEKKKVNKTRKVKTACDILDGPGGKKVGTLKVGTPIWTDGHDDGWVKVYRKAGIGYSKTDCFE